jgi:galactokinase
MSEHPSDGPSVRAYCPGRVNLIGDHTDYNDGVALPLAIDLGTTVSFTADGGSRVVLHADGEPQAAAVAIDVELDPMRLRVLEPRWARYIAAVVAVVRPDFGGTGHISTTLPIGAGLSSSAALEVATALALGFDAGPLPMARACQRAEQAATGVPTGVMDQLVVGAARADAALFIDFGDLTTVPVPLPTEVDIVVVHSGQRRTLDQSAYAARRAECEAAAVGLGPLGHIDRTDAEAIPDGVLRRRARHVATECERVRSMAGALRDGRLVEAGRIMTESHHSLAEDFEVSTPALDSLVTRLTSEPGVFGARLTGAGFGGCVVALCEPGAVDLGSLPTPAWRVRASEGARVVSAH